MPSTYDPPDADHSYNVKVMLLSAPPPEDLYEKTCHFADSGEFKQRFQIAQQQLEGKYRVGRFEIVE